MAAQGEECFGRFRMLSHSRAAGFALPRRWWGEVDIFYQIKIVMYTRMSGTPALPYLKENILSCHPFRVEHLLIILL